MKVLVVGSGGREHALVEAISRSPRLSALFAAPGNPGIAAHATSVSFAATDVHGLTAWAVEHRMDLVVVGPEAPLAAGLVDRLPQMGVRAFGPTAAAARIESSKSFAKRLMAAAGVPTARFTIAHNVQEARAALAEWREGSETPPVLKSDGLTAGKGVLVPDDYVEAEHGIATIMEDRAFGEAGATLVLEERLTGVEASLMALCAGDTILPLPAAQDYKRVGEGDTGPNTGSMGAFCPTPHVTAALRAEAVERIFRPTVAALRATGTPYQGLLYAGLMLTDAGPQVVEFNARFGDPETQAVLPLVESDLLELLAATARGELAASNLQVRDEKTVAVALVSSGYPGPYRTGMPITGLDEAAALPGVSLYHAGTALHQGRVVASGGRVLNVVGRGATFHEARERAYAAIRRIHFEGAVCRRDIAAAVSEREAA
jgi:phosphoribosylamine---glycine ligase